MNQNMLLGVFVLILMMGCAKRPGSRALEAQKEASGIIGGTDVPASDDISSTTVAIYDLQKKGLCTGSILSDQLVLTAGHCAVDASPSSLVVVFGLSLVNGPKPETRRVTDTRVDPDYVALQKKLNSNNKLDFDKMKNQGDLAIVKFSGGLPSGYKPVRLLSNSKDLIDGADVELAGYGITDGKSHTGAGTLRKVEVKVSNAHFSATEVLFDQRNQVGACHGDSGGPAFLMVGGDSYLFGVTSRGYQDPQNDCVQYSIYTNILAQSSFIQKASQELEQH